MLNPAAGLSLEDVAGSNTSVYAGYFTADYSNMSAKDPERMAKYTVAGLGGSMVSGRLSKFFDLRGTSMMIDTACSSSLVALDHACASLREGKAEMVRATSCSNVVQFQLNHPHSLSSRAAILYSHRT